MSLTIIPADKKHIPVLTGLIRKANQDVAARFGLTSENAPKHPSNCSDAWIAGAMVKGVRYFLLEADTVPCGCIALEAGRGSIGYLERLAVLPDFRRQGYGATLVRHALKEARKGGIRRVEIGIIAAHTELQRWYQGLGFEIDRTRSFDHLPFDVTFMHRNL